MPAREPHSDRRRSQESGRSREDRDGIALRRGVRDGSLGNLDEAVRAALRAKVAASGNAVIGMMRGSVVCPVLHPAGVSRRGDGRFMAQAQPQRRESQR